MLTKVHIVKAMVFLVVTYRCWELDHKEGWAPKNWYFQIVVLEKILESPLDSRRSNQSILKEINPELIQHQLKLMLKLKLQYFGHLMWRANLLKKTANGEDWGQEEKGATEDEMVWRYHWTTQLEQNPGESEGQGSLACCSPRGRKELDTTHSSTLAWKIPWMEEPGRLQSVGLLRVGHNWVTLLSLFTFMHWRRKWHPTRVFLPGESQGRGSLVGAVYGVAQSRTRLKRLSSSSSDWATTKKHM